MFEDELLLVTSPDHHLASKSFVVPEDLANERLLLYAPPPSSNFYMSFFAGTTVKPREIVLLQLTEAMLAMVQGSFAGDGWRSRRLHEQIVWKRNA